MPSSYTHQLIAEKIYEGLSAECRAAVSPRADYFLGAQGGDVFYFYNMTGGRKNIGKYFHRRNVYGVFNSFAQSVREGAEEAAVSYIAGYVTHYVADTVFHPYVYWFTAREKERTGRRRDNFHALIESDLDSYFVQKEGKELTGYRLPTSADLAHPKAIFPAVERAVAAGDGEVKLKERAFERAIDRFFRFQDAFEDPDGTRRRRLYGTEKTMRLPHFFSGLYRRTAPDVRYLNREHAEWYYPAEPSVRSRESADDLFSRSVQEGIRLTESFFRAAREGAVLDGTDFSRHFLTGLPAL